MAYTDPTATTIKARFPEFAGVADATITALIVEAGSFVDQSWLEGDFTLAKSLYVAHTLTVEGRAAAANVQGAATLLNALPAGASIKSGDLQVSKSAAGGSGSSGGGSVDPFAATTYGQRYIDLRSRSFPPIFAII